MTESTSTTAETTGATEEATTTVTTPSAEEVSAQAAADQRKAEIADIAADIDALKTKLGNLAATEKHPVIEHLEVALLKALAHFNQ